MSEGLTCETGFCKKAQNFVYFGSSDFDQISPACGKHSYGITNGFLTSTVINSNGNMKELERKIKFEKLMFR